MRILSLYINSFGKFQNYKLDFSKNMNSIYEENGWGKTTLTAFIKSMLYGITSKTTRTKYTPWNSNDAFGGALIVCVKNNNFRIERKFDAKKASLDELHVYDLKTNLEINNIENNLGELFLNLNENSFERSVFIPEAELDEGFGSDIEAKLANLIGGTNDSQSYDDAMNILDMKVKELKSNSKKGLIIDKKRELDRIDSEIDDCNIKINNIKEINAEITNIKKEIDALNKNKKDVNQQILDITKEQDKKSKLLVAKKYEEDIIATKKQLDDNNYVFNGHDISPEEVLAIRAKNKELINLKYEYELKKNSKLANVDLEETKFQLGFKDFVPSDEDINRISKRIQKYQNIKGIITAHTAEPEKKKPVLAFLFLIIAIITLICGVGLLIYGFLKDNENIRMAGFIVGPGSLLIFIITIFLFMLHNSKNQNISYGRVKSYDFELRQTEDEIREFFSKFHLYSSDYDNNLFIVRSNQQKYNEIKSQSNSNTEGLNELDLKIKKYENSINKFLEQFNSTAITNEEKIGELNTHLRRKVEFETILNQKQASYDKFYKDNDLDNIKSNIGDIDSLNQMINDIDNKINELNKNLTINSNKIVQYEIDIAKLDDLIDSKENIIEDIDKLEEEYRLLNISAKYLESAQHELLEKYVKPMKDSVDKYVNLLLTENEEDYNIDVNFKFQFITRNGIKGLDQYSRGYQTIIALCMRLALIDCLYPNEKPFVIFDDPFVNFDDLKLELCKKMMKNISKQYQIIYFTCHDSRAIK